MKDVNIFLFGQNHQLKGIIVGFSTEKVAKFFLDKTWNVSLHLYPEGYIFPFWAHTMDELLIHFSFPSFIPLTTTSNSTYSIYLSPVLSVLLIISFYQRKQL